MQEFAVEKMENDDEFVIKTKYAECTDYVFVKRNELSFENYCIEGKNNYSDGATSFFTLFSN